MSGALDHAVKSLRLLRERGFQAVRLGALATHPDRAETVLDAARALGYRVQRRAGETWVVLS